MNIARIKSVEEIAANLRAKGELDEEALARFEQWSRKILSDCFWFCSIPSFILIINFSLWSVAIIIAMIFGVYFNVFLPYKNKQLFLLNLLANGKITNGIVTEYNRTFQKYIDTGFTVNISYIAADGNEYQNKNKIYGTRMLDLDNEIKRNSKVLVVYSENNPEESWIYTEKLNNIYNIRKKYMATAPAPVTKIA